MNKVFIAIVLCLAFAATAIDARPQSVEDVQGKGVCTICNFAVNLIEQYLQKNETQQQIITKLQKFCSILGSLEPQCDAFIASEASALIQLLVEKEPASKVCAQVHACTNGSKAFEKAVKQVEKAVKLPEDTACGLCELVISSVEQWLASNQTQQQIQTNLENVCNSLPGGISSLCDQFVEQYLPLAIQWILNNEPPQTFCTQLSLCTSKRISARPVLPKPAKPIRIPKDGSLCGICELTIASVEQWLQQNSTTTEIEQYLQNVCGLLPSSIGALCDQFVVAYYPQAVQWILNNEPPQTFCTQVGVCTSMKAVPLRKVQNRRH